jgi:hypothetical protein
MRAKIALRILVIPVVLAVVVSCMLPCSAVDPRVNEKGDFYLPSDSNVSLFSNIMPDDYAKIRSTTIGEKGSWPTFCHDFARTGHTNEVVEPPLKLL